jgi:drug/metabolite transporter (DMT)-like permease
LNQLSNIFIFILAALVLKEPVTLRRLIAIILAFGGALLVFFG